jgi:hypothetical protein
VTDNPDTPVAPSLWERYDKRLLMGDAGDPTPAKELRAAIEAEARDSRPVAHQHEWRYSSVEGERVCIAEGHRDSRTVATSCPACRSLHLLHREALTRDEALPAGNLEVVVRDFERFLHKVKDHPQAPTALRSEAERLLEQG